MTQTSRIHSALEVMKRDGYIQEFFNEPNTNREDGRNRWFVQINERASYYLNTGEVKAFINGARSIKPELAEQDTFV
tara:strand:- start:3404 stop:3634 length:231 start_codon:yes stop_codon:yes gene_type:complete